MKMLNFNSLFSPLEQFEIFPFFGVSFWSTFSEWTTWGLANNADIVFFLGISELVLIVWLLNSMSFLFPHFLGNLLQVGLGAASGLLRSTVDRGAQSHLVVLVSFFIFIALLNGLGLVPFGFCLTSHLVVTQFLGGFAIVGLTLKGIQTLGFRWLNLFIPRNVPLVMLPFLSLIEIISYLSRMLSLSIRLFANMVAGHALLHILLGALLNVTQLGLGVAVAILLVVLPTLLVFLIFILEFGIAFLQAYVFAVLYLIYLTDSFKSH